jgi:hypothetical protein
MNYLYKTLLLNLFVYLINSLSLYKDIHYFDKLDFFNNLKIYNNLKSKQPIILNGIKTSLKKNFCNIFCDINDIEFKPYSFDNFILKKPHLKYDNTMIYVKDYLIGNGRILNEYEKEAMNSISNSSNMVILETDNIDTIPFKDFYLNKRFSIIYFPKISKKDYIRYIYDIIIYYKYNDDLLLLNWDNYNIQSLDYEKINMLLFELNSMLNDNLTIKDLNYYMDSIIIGLIENSY